MANSKMLKEAIADAKAVRETAIANAKIALEEAFTPQLQSILSKKLQAEMEEEDEDEYEEEELDEDLGSSEIGNGDNKEPASVANTATTDLSGIDNESSSVGSEDENTSVVKKLDEEEGYEDEDEMEMEKGDYEDDEMEEDEDFGDGEDFADDDFEDDEEDLDLEAVIAELENELSEEDYEDEDEEMEFDMEEEVNEDDEMAAATGMDDVTNADDAELDTDHFDMDESEEMDDEEELIDLEEILREMGYGDDEEEMEDEMDEGDHEDDSHDYEAELEEAYSTIKQLRSTINEVNLLNAKLLYANKLFKGYALNNEQKAKVVENLDRTSSVREVKLVYATLAESMNFSGTDRKKTRRISESITRPSKSTAPKKEMITESSNELADRFQKLAGIKKEIL